MEPDSAIYKKICSLAAEFKSGKLPSEDEVADWNGQEWELYLENLPTDVEASQVCLSTAISIPLEVEITLLLVMI
jgi:leukotriene-A4 hydrolase